MLRAQLASVVAVSLIFGLVLFALPEKGYSGISSQISCCQSDGSCRDSSGGPIVCPVEDFVPNAFCDQDTGLCTQERVNSIPTLTEWGLVAMAAVLASAGFVVIRRKRAAA